MLIKTLEQAKEQSDEVRVFDIHQGDTSMGDWGSSPIYNLIGRVKGTPVEAFNYASKLRKWTGMNESLTGYIETTIDVVDISNNGLVPPKLALVYNTLAPEFMEEVWFDLEEICLKYGKNFKRYTRGISTTSVDVDGRTRYQLWDKEELVNEVNALFDKRDKDEKDGRIKAKNH